MSVQMECQQLIEISPDLIFLFDINNQIVMLNTRAADYLNVSQVEVVGKNIQYVLPDWLSLSFIEHVETVKQSHKSSRFEVINNETIFDFLIIPQQQNEQAPSYFAVFGHDITIMRNAWTALSESDNTYQNLFNSISDAVYILDKDHVFIDVNEGAVQMYGYNREFFIGKTPAVLSPENRNDMQATVDLLEKAYHGEPQQFEWWGLRKNGEIFPKLVSVNQGKYFGQTVVFAIARDVTEWNRLHEEIRQQTQNLLELNSTKDLFFNIIAHDLKSPFNAMLGFSTILEEEYDDYSDEDRKHFIHNLHVAAESAFKLLQNLLEWSRTQTGRLEFKPDYVDISSLINENLIFYKAQALAKRIKIVSRIQFNTVVFGDENMLRTIIRNLFSNALKFSYPDDIVEIYSTANEHFISIFIKDNGTGIPADIQSRLFRIDELIKSPGTDNEIGTGLGLILCKEFISRNNGTISFKTEIGKGTEFCFNVPKQPFLEKSVQ
jgi:PAS domain S-box-containing protein